MVLNFIFIGGKLLTLSAKVTFSYNLHTNFYCGKSLIFPV